MSRLILPAAHFWPVPLLIDPLQKTLFELELSQWHHHRSAFLSLGHTGFADDPEYLPCLHFDSRSSQLNQEEPDETKDIHVEITF